MIITSIAHINPLRIVHNSTTVCDEAPVLKGAYRILDLDYPKFYKMDALCQAGIIGAELLSRDRELNARYKDDRVALLFNNNTSSLASDLKHTRLTEENKPSPSVFVYTLPNIVLGEIAIRHKWYGEQLCTVSETPNLELIASIINSMVSANKADAIMYINLDATPTSFGGTVALFEKEPSADNKVQASYLHQILTSHG